MKDNNYYKPRLMIGNTEVTSNMSGALTISGGNQANSLKCTISDPQFQNFKLFNEEIKLYLNYGSEDGVPIFRGFIKDISPNDSKTDIKAIDGRSYISSQSSKMVELTETKNYDGYTLSAFLYSFINEEINTNSKTYIGLDLLKDTNPSVSMNLRAKSSPAYKLVLQKLKEAIDDSDIENPLSYFIDMIDDGEKSNITFVKEKQLTDVPSLYLGFNDGIKSYNYNRRAPASHAIGGDTSFTYGNQPTGSVTMNLSGKYKDRNEARQDLIKKLLLQYRETDEISIQATKGHYVNLGSIVRIVTDNEDISGNHRVTSKNIKFDTSGISLSLGLNKKPTILSDYINI